MSVQVDNAFVRQYESEAWAVFQRAGSILRPAVRTKDGVIGSSTTFQKIGKGSATTKARHGVITPMNQDHTAIQCTINDFYAADWVDKLDEAKLNIDERMAIAEGAAYALGRKVDDQIITELGNTTQSTVSWTVTSQAAVRNSLLRMVKALYANDVPNDGQNYGALTPQAWAMAMTVDEFKRADYLGPNGLPYVQGGPNATWINWMNVLWTIHTGLTGVGTSSASVFCWHKRSIGYATGANPSNVAAYTPMSGGQMGGGSPIAADITWHGDRQAHFVANSMAGGAKLIDDTGVIKGTLDDTAALPTS